MDDLIRGDVGEDADSSAIGKNIEQRSVRHQANPHQSQRMEFLAAQNISEIQIAISEIRQGLHADRNTRQEMRQDMQRMVHDINTVSRQQEKMLDLERTFDRRMMFFEKQLEEQLKNAYRQAVDYNEKQIRQVYTWMVVGWFAIPLLMAFLNWMATR